MSSKSLNWENKDTVLGIIMLLCGIGYGILVLKIPGTRSQLFDSRFVPSLISVLIIIVGILQIGTGLRSPKEKIEKKEFDKKTVVCTFALIALYILLYSSVGFIIMTFLFLFLEMNILTPGYVRKNQVVYLIISLFFSVGIYYLFYFGFSIFLPGGLLDTLL
ncbi:tripartite tricarboxylate transporter TctB family protein [Fusobacterium sp.]|uniref:tripartite tricarboxylate transporter TctB family protein n=1 Tax=Fusobacterium sp. TaxID=68766 RepID=UPI0028FFCFF5|nr:tripartite tricarboxylate transporter TctB family protein [Fusobacterium sp.]MDU1910683.1 tripartite tricarboxylate transporter TctB family protein [Fusobacterium sp.]